MSSSDIITALLVVVVLILGLSYLGKFFERLSSKALKYVDYGSFAVAGITGALIYFGKGNAPLRYLFLASIVVYFITLRHTVHAAPPTGD